MRKQSRRQKEQRPAETEVQCIPLRDVPMNTAHGLHKRVLFALLPLIDALSTIAPSDTGLPLNAVVPTSRLLPPEHPEQVWEPGWLRGGPPAFWIGYVLAAIYVA